MHTVINIIAAGLTIFVAKYIPITSMPCTLDEGIYESSSSPVIQSLLPPSLVHDIIQVLQGIDLD